MCIAGTGTVDPAAVSTGEADTAFRANIMVSGHPSDLIGVSLPPCHAAGIRAEPFGLSVGRLIDLLTAVFAAGRRRIDADFHRMSAAVGLHAIYGQPHFQCNSLIAVALFLKELDLAFFDISHLLPPYKQKKPTRYYFHS